jgi:gamma-glutamylcyclotransferase (GGCT)/AIG2-like uncharacterized protein YtfP
MFYLAYGMNSNKNSMAQRCPAAKSLGSVILEGHKLAFKHFCDAIVDEQSHMVCALWDITENCERSLDALEGYPHFYGKKEVEVMHNGRNIRAMIYYMKDYYDYGIPSRGYLDMVVEGYRQHNIEVSQIVDALEELEECT